MCVPTHFAADAATVRELPAGAGAADLVTATPEGLRATPLPWVHDPAAGPRGALRGHLARANDQWRLPALGEAMVIVRGPDAYVSPSWCAAKAERGRVVPTWNHLTAHVHGEPVVHDDAARVEEVVRALAERHERDRPVPWSVDDAPDGFVAAHLRAVRGCRRAGES